MDVAIPVGFLFNMNTYFFVDSSYHWSVIIEKYNLSDTHLNRLFFCENSAWQLVFISFGYVKENINFTMFKIKG